MEEHLLNSLKVAEILHVSRSFAYLQMKHGDLPTVRIGNAIRVKATDLESFIREKELQKLAAPVFVHRRQR